MGILLVIVLLVAFEFGYYYFKIKPIRDQTFGELEVPRLPPVEGFAFDQFGLTTLAGPILSYRYFGRQSRGFERMGHLVSGLRVGIAEFNILTKKNPGTR
jgi:hypothetical protein